MQLTNHTIKTIISSMSDSKMAERKALLDLYQTTEGNGRRYYLVILLTTHP